MFRIRKATVQDVDTIFRLTNESATEGLMLARSKYKIVTMLRGFNVAEEVETGTVVGSGALSMLWTDMAEIMALAVDKRYRQQGVGRMIVESLLEEARSLLVPEVIALTYQEDFFKKLGFVRSSKDMFPRKLWRECLECPKLENCDEIVMYRKI